MGYGLVRFVVVILLFYSVCKSRKKLSRVVKAKGVRLNGSLGAHFCHSEINDFLKFEKKRPEKLRHFRSVR